MLAQLAAGADWKLFVQIFLAAIIKYLPKRRHRQQWGQGALLRVARPDLTAAKLPSLLVETGIWPTQIMSGNKAFDYVVFDAAKFYAQLLKFK